MKLATSLSGARALAPRCAPLLVAAFLTTACGSAPPPPPPTPLSAVIPVVPLRLTITAPPQPAVTYELKTDGVVYNGTSPMLRITGDHITDPQGGTILTLSPDGLISGPQIENKTTITADNDIITGATRLHINDGGQVTQQQGTNPPGAGPMRFEGFAPASRRTAILLAATYFIILTPHAAPGQPAAH